MHRATDSSVRTRMRLLLSNFKMTEGVPHQVYDDPSSQLRSLWVGVLLECQKKKFKHHHKSLL